MPFEFIYFVLLPVIAAVMLAWNTWALRASRRNIPRCHMCGDTVNLTHVTRRSMMCYVCLAGNGPVIP